jgi:DNA-binding NarL/FixJ family response regulator
VIRVLVAASSPVVRAGLDALVRSAPELDVVGTVADDVEVVAEGVERLGPDVVLLELERQGDPAASPPLALLAALSPTEAPRASPATVLLADGADVELATAALRAGVRSVLPRGATGAVIVAAVKGAAAGLVVVSVELVESMLATASRASPLATEHGSAVADGAAPLTARELEVLGMLAEGLGNKQIAPRLGITEHTVKYHVASIFAKLGASSRTEAVTIGARRGLVML